MEANSIGERLKELRAAKGKTISEVAKAVGISESALSMYECNQRVPRDNIKVALADYYNKPIGKIFYAKNVHSS